MIPVTSMRIVMMVMFVIAKVRLGSEEEHREWDAREELRPKLEKEVKEVLGEKMDEVMFTLLADDAVIKALRGGEMEKLAMLIKKKRETYLPSLEKGKMLTTLKAAAE